MISCFRSSLTGMMLFSQFWRRFNAFQRRRRLGRRVSQHQPSHWRGGLGHAGHVPVTGSITPDTLPLVQDRTSKINNRQLPSPRPGTRSSVLYGIVSIA